MGRHFSMVPAQPFARKEAVDHSGVRSSNFIFGVANGVRCGLEWRCEK